MTDARLETLIARYEAAIYSHVFSASRVDQLSRLVEARADAIGYTDHARLMALHTAAERRAETLEAIREECKRPMPPGC